MAIRNIFLILLLFVMALFLAISGRVAQQLSILELPYTTINYAEGSPLSGQMFIDITHPAQTQWLRLDWQWCPGFNPLRWCISVDGDVTQGNMMISTNLSQIDIYQTLVEMEHIDFSLNEFIQINADLSVQLSEVQLDSGRLLDKINQLDARVSASNINIAGKKLKPHKFSINKTKESDFHIAIQGEQLNGTIDVKTDGTYKTNLTLQENRLLLPLLEKQFKRNKKDEFMFKYEGRLAL